LVKKSHSKNNLLKMENKFEILTERKNVLNYFLFYALINALLLYYIHDIIITDPQFFTGGNARSVNLFRQFWRVFYFISPFYEWIKILVIGFLVYQALKFIKKQIVPFWGIFYIVLLGQFLLLVPDLMELIWFTFIKTDYSMQDVQSFSPLSLTVLVNNENISEFTFKILSAINLFNLFYWLLLCYLIQKFSKISLKDSVLIVLSFYGVLVFIINLIEFYISFKMSYAS